MQKSQTRQAVPVIQWWGGGDRTVLGFAGQPVCLNWNFKFNKLHLKIRWRESEGDTMLTSGLYASVCMHVRAHAHTYTHTHTHTRNKTNVT